MTFVFYDDQSLVWTHPESGAPLFQGNRVAACKLSSETGASSLAVVADNMDLSAHKASAGKLGYGKFVSAPLRDVGSMIQSELEQTKRWANEVAVVLLEDLIRGRSALVCCWSGYNRSGLVAALVMTKAGIEPQVAIDTLREKRSQWVLNNNLFERIVRGEA